MVEATDSSGSLITATALAENIDGIVFDIVLRTLFFWALFNFKHLLDSISDCNMRLFSYWIFSPLLFNLSSFGLLSLNIVYTGGVDFFIIRQYKLWIFSSRCIYLYEDLHILTNSFRENGKHLQKQKWLTSFATILYVLLYSWQWLRIYWHIFL